MNLELLRGVSTYFLIHECCPWNIVWVNYRIQSPACPLCSPGTSQHSFDTPFSLCSSYPQTQWCSLTHSWLVLIFHFLCQVTVGVLFHVLFRGWMLSAIFPRSPLWQFSCPPCDHECLSSWLSHSVAAALASLWSSELPERRRVQRARQAIFQWLKGSPSVLLPKCWMKKSCKSVDKYPLETHAYLWAPKKEEQFVNMSLKTTEESYHVSEWFKANTA